MEVSEQLKLKVGSRVLVNDKSRLDHCFQGQRGMVVTPITSNGFVRLHLHNDLDTVTVLVHPESVELD